MRLGGCLWVALLLSTTGSLCLNSRSSIVGGKDARPGKWPWMVSLSMTDGKRNLTCGGSLISHQWVMTAAHCVNNRNVQSVVAGRLKLREHTGWKYSVRRVITHPRYDRCMYKNDLALVQLDKPVELSRSTVWPVSLPTPTDVFDTRSKCWVTGWGKVLDNATLGGNKTLQQLRVPLLDQKTCKSKWRHHISSKQLCAGFLEGGKGSCQGDSGGPLVCKLHGRFVQVGVVSFAAEVSCVLAGHPAVFTRVSRYAGFIDRVIHQYS